MNEFLFGARRGEAMFLSHSDGGGGGSGVTKAEQQAAGTGRTPSESAVMAWYGVSASSAAAGSIAASSSPTAKCSSCRWGWRTRQPQLKAPRHGAAAG